MELRQQEENKGAESGYRPTTNPATTVKTPSMEEIVRNLSSRNRSVRAGAEMLLQALGPTHADELLHVLELEGEKYRKQKRNGKYLGYALGILALLYVVIGVTVGLRSGNWDMFTSFGSFGGVFGSAGAAAALATPHKSILKVIAGLEDLRSVGWLIDTLESQDKEIKQTCEQTLTKLLPRMTFADGPRLDDDRRRVLDWSLRKTKSYDFASAILSAYNVLGDSHSLQAVETMAAGNGVLKQSEITYQAGVVAESIRSRMAAELASQTLLRATVSPSEPMEVLLRPVQGAGGQINSQLLRPAEVSGSETESLLLRMSNADTPQ